MKEEFIKFHKTFALSVCLQMTFNQKVSQLRHHSKAIKKLGIKEYNWWNECLHGVARAGLATVFPQAIAMAATFDCDTLYNVGDIISTEARAKFNLAQKTNDFGIYKGLTFWSPNINIYRDPRWGRGQETYGECPTLTSKLAVSFIEGLQGNDDKYLKVSACAKHFAVHSGPEAERHFFDCKISKKDLYETYLTAFENAVKIARVESVMTAYNRLNGEPCSCSKTLLRDILRNDWGFDGHVVSDCGAVGDIIFNHKTEPNTLKATKLALVNGLDLECGIFFSMLAFTSHGNKTVRNAVDRAVTKLLTTRSKLGMFASDCVYDKLNESVIACAEHENYAISTAEKGIVLLKNNGVLPLNNLSNTALFGYNATNNFAYLGNYYGEPSSIINVLDALKDSNPSLPFSVAFPICGSLNNEQIREYEKAVSLAKQNETIIICCGIDSTIEGEAGDTGAGKDGIIGEQGDRRTIGLPQIQIKFIEEVSKLQKRIILLNFSGGAISFSPILDKVDAILQCWYPGAKGGIAIKNILLGNVSPSGKLPVTFYNSDNDLSDFKDYSLKNRTYRYFNGAPQFPFGYGLSYTKFLYKNVLFKNNNDNITISFDIENSGDFDSDEVSQLYLSYPKQYTAQPNYKLIDFKRAFIAQKATVNLEFCLTKDSLSAINENGEKVFLNGIHKLYLCNCAPNFANIKFEFELSL